MRKMPNYANTKKETTIMLFITPCRLSTLEVKPLDKSNDRGQRGGLWGRIGPDRWGGGCSSLSEILTETTAGDFFLRSFVAECTIDNSAADDIFFTTPPVKHGLYMLLVGWMSKILFFHKLLFSLLHAPPHPLHPNQETIQIFSFVPVNAN